MASCPVTQPNGSTPPAERSSPYHHGNGAIWTTLYPLGTVLFQPGGPGFIEPDGTLSMKWWWWRDRPGMLTIEGRRLDAPAPPLSATIPDGYQSSSFQASGLDFPTPGCWEVTGSAGGSSLTFVTRVVLLVAQPAGRIAFSAGGSLYTINADGSKIKRLGTGARDADPYAWLTHGEASAWASAPAISPDASQIAFARDLDVWLINADGTGERRLGDVANFIPSAGASNGTVGVSNLAWSPDGRQIVYTLMRVGGSGISGVGNLDVSTGQSVRLHAAGADTGLFQVASWLPDGRIAIGSRSGVLGLIDPETDRELPPNRVTRESPFQASLDYAPDGRWLVGSIGMESPILFGWPGIMNKVAQGTSPVFSPDGKWIAYFKGESLRLIRIDGSADHEIVDLTPLGGRDRHFAVTPDCYPDRLPGCSYRPPAISWGVIPTK
jgi:hypothetical protein